MKAFPFAIAIIFAFPVLTIAFIYWVEFVGRLFETVFGRLPI